MAKTKGEMNTILSRCMRGTWTRDVEGGQQMT